MIGEWQKKLAAHMVVAERILCGGWLCPAWLLLASQQVAVHRWSC